MPLPFRVADRDAGAVRIIDDGEAGVPDPRPASWEKIRELPVPAMTFVRQPTVEDAIPGFQSGNDGTGLVELCVDFTYTLVRSPDDRAAPENLRELDEGTRRALEELPYRNRPDWVVEMAERLRFPQLHEAVRTSWHREEHERSTVDAILLHHVNHVLRNYVRAERGWDGRLGSLNPAPDVTAAAIQRDARVVVDGRMLDGIRIDTDPHVYGLGAALPSGGVLTVVVPRDELDHLTLEFQTYVAETSVPPPAAAIPQLPRRLVGPAPAPPPNPWPRDMVISVGEDSTVLLELLWIREAWQLRPMMDDPPPLLVDTPAVVGESERRAAPIAEWEDAWPGIWRDALRFAGTPRDDHAFDRMRSASPGDERAALIKEMIGPSWDDIFGRDALTEDHQRWQRAVGERRMAQSMNAVGEQPEHVALDAVIAAWRTGLTTIVQIPCRGSFTRVIGAHTLLLTAEARADIDRYRSALALFR